MSEIKLYLSPVIYNAMLAKIGQEEMNRNSYVMIQPLNPENMKDDLSLEHFTPIRPRQIEAHGATIYQSAGLIWMNDRNEVYELPSGRFDSGVYSKKLSESKNFIPQPPSKILRRSGTQHLCELPPRRKMFPATMFVFKTVWGKLPARRARLGFNNRLWFCWKLLVVK